MTGKHYNCHNAWRRDGAGLLVHESGLRVRLEELDDGSLDAVTDDASTEAWSAFELARGVPLHDLQARLLRLVSVLAEGIANPLSAAMAAGKPPPFGARNTRQRSQ